MIYSNIYKIFIQFVKLCLFITIWSKLFNNINEELVQSVNLNSVKIQMIWTPEFSIFIFIYFFKSSENIIYFCFQHDKLIKHNGSWIEITCTTLNLTRNSLNQECAMVFLQTHAAPDLVLSDLRGVLKKLHPTHKPPIYKFICIHGEK